MCILHREVKCTSVLQNNKLGSIFLKALGTHVKSLQESLSLHDSPDLYICSVSMHSWVLRYTHIQYVMVCLIH